MKIDYKPIYNYRELYQEIFEFLKKQNFFPLIVKKLILFQIGLLEVHIIVLQNHLYLVEEVQMLKWEKLHLVTMGYFFLMNFPISLNQF